MTELTHNIVLSFDEERAASFVDFAQNHLAEHSQDYCLSAEAIPHITLAHTSTKSGEVQEKITEKLNSLDIEKPNINPIGFSYSFRNNGEYIISEIIIKKSDQLLDLHNQACDVLNELDLPVLNASRDNYYPHITFSKVIDRTLPNVSIPSSFMEDIKDELFLSFGTSDNMGQYTSVIWQKGLN